MFCLVSENNFENSVGPNNVLSDNLFWNFKNCEFSNHHIKKESLAEVFSCEFDEFLGTPLFNRTPPVAASEDTRRDIF